MAEFARSEGDAQLSLFVNLDGFEGPIDLLLSLAREQKVDLGKIAILPLAEQYLAYIQSARKIDLEIAADYLVMAAWLAYLKSRLLLPELEPEQQEEVIDMSDALRFQLLRLEAMQSAAKRLADMPLLGVSRLTRAKAITIEKTEQIAWEASLYDLLSAYGDIRSSAEASTLTVAATRLFSVQDAVERLERLVGRSADWMVLQSFLPSGLGTPLDRRSAVASHFVASLELAKQGILTIRQANAYAPVYIKSKEQNAWQIMRHTHIWQIAQIHQIPSK